MNQQTNHTSLAERLVDSQVPSLSFRDVLSKVFLRPKLFVLAMLIPAILAASMANMVPVEWSASTKVLIRYSAAEAGFLKNIVSEGGLNLSGATSAELIKSSPVLERTIDKVHIQPEDIYQPSGRIISNKFAGFFDFIFGSNSNESADNSPAKAAIDRNGLIDSFKASLDSSSKKSSNSQSVAILEKTSMVPESLKLDELITIEVKSFNREKVDDMANGLADAFIEEYFNLFTQQAKRQADYIDTLVKQEEQELKRVERASAAEIANSSGLVGGSGRELVSRESPIIASMAAELSVAEAALTKAQQLYASSSPQVTRLSRQVANLKFMLEKQERIEIQKQLIEQLKTKRYQAQNAENISKSDLIPISIIERADEPKQSGSKKMLRVLISTTIGLLLGFILATSLMVIFNVLDPRIHFKNEIANVLSMPIVGQIPLVKKACISSVQAICDHEKINQDAWQLITKLGEKNTDKLAKVITISSAIEAEGATFCSTVLALNLAKNSSYKICMIDANLNDAGLSKFFKFDNKAGFIEAIINGNFSFSPPVKEGRLWLIGAGNLANRSQLGHYANQAQHFIEQLKTEYDFIIIDAGATLKSNESLVFGKLADQMILVAASGVSRKNAFSAAIQKLQAGQVDVDGIIFNRSRNVLPEFLYRLF